MTDMKLSVVRRWKNGAIISGDNLEASIRWNSPFAAGFMEIILDFSMCLNAPLGRFYFGMITYKLTGIR
jgi:hypothetical protein